MRVALLASTIALLAGTPAFAQCVYVACGGSVPNPTVNQQPVYQAPVQTNVRGDYDAGYAAGLAARPRTRVVTRVVTRTVTRPAHRATVSQPARRHVGFAKARPTTRPAVRHVARVAPRAVVRHVARVAPRPVARPVRTVSHSYSQQSYVDPIKNRAGSYGATSFGSSTNMSTLMSRTTWVGPSSVTSQNGQSCGWGARIVINDHGQAQRQAMWVCQCPQGWRPPGY